MHGCEYGIFTNSGTSSLLASLQALKELHGWKDGAEVIVPSLTFVASVNAIVHAGLKPVLVDVCEETYNIDFDLIGREINPDSVAIIPVHLFGMPSDVEIISSIAYGSGLAVVEDSCECVLSKDNEQPVGSWGDVGCFSTYAAHHLVTGVGGLCTTSDKDLALKIRSIVNHGIDVSELPSGTFYDPSHLARKFSFTSIGHSFRPTELEAALGLSQIDDLPKIVEKRRKNARYLYGKLTPLLAWLQLPLMHPEHSFMVFPIVLRELNAAHLIKHLSENGIESRRMMPLTNQPCYDFNPADYPVSQWINNSGFYVGVHQGLDFTDMDKIVEVITEYFE
jgi:CDP-6-deoxy-D-xylo-4-hexulose-3-dehydrase